MNWRKEIAQIEAIKAGLDLKGVENVTIDSGITVLDGEAYYDVELETVKANMGNKWFEPALIRLKTFVMIVKMEQEEFSDFSKLIA